jgi:hypothetical protein
VSSTLSVFGTRRWLRARVLHRALTVATVLLLLMPVVLIPLVTLSFDEAWIIGGTANIALEGRFGMGSTVGSTSTGGLFAAAQALAAAVFGRNLYVARTLVFVSLLFLVREVVVWVRLLAGGRPVSWVAVALAVGIPGLVFFGSTADGVVPALWLLLWAVRTWFLSPDSAPRFPRSIGVGLLLGLCVATRTNFLLAIPALLIATFFGAAPIRPRLVQAVVVAAVATATWAANLAVLISLSKVGLDQNSGEAQYAWGLSGLLSSLHPNAWTAKVMALQDALPLGVVAVAALVVVPGLTRWLPRSGASQAVGAILVFGLGLLAAWLVGSKDLYRYVLPALFTIVFGLLCVGVRLLRDARPATRHLALLLGAVLALGQLFAELSRNARIALHGSSDDAILWFTNRRTTDGLFALSAHRAEKATAEFLRSLPPESRMDCVGPDALDMIFFTGREVRSIPARPQSGGGPAADFLLLRPALGVELLPSDEARRWLSENCVVERRFDRVFIYRVRSGARYPDDPKTFDWRAWMGPSGDVARP